MKAGNNRLGAQGSKLKAGGERQEAAAKENEVKHARNIKIPWNHYLDVL